MFVLFLRALDEKPLGIRWDTVLVYRLQDLCFISIDSDVQLFHRGDTMGSQQRFLHSFQMAVGWVSCVVFCGEI